MRKLSRAYAAAETLWYLRGFHSVDMLCRYAPSYKTYADENGHAYGAYGPRVMPQLPVLIETLKHAMHSRQAVVAIWKPEDLATACRENTVKDMPCTLSWQFIVRDDKLHMTVTMRSNDAWLGFPYDVFAFTCMQRVIAAHLDISVGLYHHQVCSMHLYQRNVDQADFATKRGQCISLHHPWVLDDTLSSCTNAVMCEQQLRTTGTCDAEKFSSLGSMCHDLVAACAGALGRDLAIPYSEAMRC